MHTWAVTRGLVLGALLGAVAAACSSGSGSESGMSSADFAAQYCALLKPCCAEVGLPASDQQGCRAFVGAVPIQDSSAAQQCLEEVRAQTQVPGFCDDPGTLSESPACNRAFPQSHGSKAPGEPCTTDSDCAASSEGEVSCRIQICQLAKHSAAGEACIGEIRGRMTIYFGGDSTPTIALCDRADSLFCDAGAHCATLQSAGGACAGADGCADDLYCAAQLCAAKLPAGSSCADPEACDATSYCDLGDSMCHTAIAEGAACAHSSECVTENCDSATNTCKSLGSLALVFFCQ